MASGMWACRSTPRYRPMWASALSSCSRGSTRHCAITTRVISRSRPGRRCGSEVREAEMTGRNLGRLLLAAAFCAGICAANSAAAQQVGVTGAVNPASKAVLGGNVRVLDLGAAIIHDEHLQTSASGSLQVVFLDKTTLILG